MDTRHVESEVYSLGIKEDLHGGESTAIIAAFGNI